MQPGRDEPRKDDPGLAGQQRFSRESTRIDANELSNSQLAHGTPAPHHAQKRRASGTPQPGQAVQATETKENRGRQVHKSKIKDHKSEILSIPCSQDSLCLPFTFMPLWRDF